MTKETPSNTVFIRKLTEIVEANLSDENFGVKELAEKSGMSHSQIHRKLYALTKQSTSQFIREIRLNKAKELLQQELTTVAEVAYKVGFGSPTYFNKCFHDYFGYPPGEHKNHKNNVGITENITSIVDEDFSANQTIQTNAGQRSIFQNKFIQIAFGILFIVALSFFTYSYFNENSVHTIRDKSIAVLPLRYLSNDTENQHLADGIMEDILNRLSQIHDFEVKSRISSYVYDSPKIAIHDIAKDLGVSYVLEGSLFKNGDKVRLYVQLIDAKNDNPVWSDKYDNDLSDIFVFVSDVSQKIADELQATLSPKEKEQIGKKYTENKEAYNLYLEGRFYWQLRGEDNLRKSIEYFNRALEIDSNYCLPYAGLADAYTILAWFQFEPWQEAIPKSREYIQKALAIDNDLAEVHATMGVIATFFDYNWDLAEREFQQAIEINPNYATAYQWYSEYLDLIGKRDKARICIDKALELKPHTAVMLSISYWYYLKNGNYNKALEVAEKIFRIDGNSTENHSRKFRVYLRQGNEEMAIEEFKNILVASGNKTDTVLESNISFQYGLEGILSFKISNQIKSDSIKESYKIAENYVLLGKKNNAIKYLTLAYDNGVNYIPRIKYDPVFKELRTDPRFLDLLEKMNLGGY